MSHYRFKDSLDHNLLSLIDKRSAVLGKTSSLDSTSQRLFNLIHPSTGILSRIFGTQTRQIKSEHSVEETRLASYAELNRFRCEIEELLGVTLQMKEIKSEKLQQDGKLESEKNWITFRHKITNLFDQADFELLNDFEKALNRCPLPDTANPLINKARENRIRNCCQIYNEAINDLTIRIGEFNKEFRRISINSAY